MTFRHPLRNDWDAVAGKFRRMAKSPGRDGAMARVMLDIMPGFLTALERERDLRTAPLVMFDAIAAACGMMIENAVEHHPHAPPRQALQHMLALIQRNVLPQLEAHRKSVIIRPEEFTR